MELGSDEAGKGPVLGPMVVAAVGVKKGATVPDAVADSKTLSPTRRAALAAKLEAANGVTIGIEVVPVDRIDDPETDMNTLAVEGHAAAIDEVLVAADSQATGLADACDTAADRFADRVTDCCESPIELEARHGADSEDALVAAASIIAKVTRDEHIEQLAAEYDRAIGSGYPSDTTTRAFLEEYTAEHGTMPACARKSWSTCETILQDVEQTGIEEF